MSFIEKYQQAQSVTIDGNIFIPPNYHGETNIIIPDEIVTYCTNFFGLLQKNIRVLDPMCGVGTIPRVINALGGDCIGVEINKDRYLAATSLVSHEKLIHGDFRKVPLGDGGFQCIFTSLPFIWFKDEESVKHLDTSYANRFAELLAFEGFVLLDSMTTVERDGERWPVAKLQAEYFCRNGFAIDKIIKFNTNSQNRDNQQSIIMKLVKMVN